MAQAIHDEIQKVTNVDLSVEWVEEKAPAWLLKAAEKSPCSGTFIEIPCCDAYAPNVSGCCCIPPMYSAAYYNLDEFYNKVMPNLRTGDIYLCSWPKEDGTDSARCIFHSRWTHVGIIYRPSDAPHILKQRITRNRDHGSQSDPSRPLVAEFLAVDGPAFFLGDFEVQSKNYLDKFNMLRADQDPSQFSPFMFGVRFLTGMQRDDNFYQHFENAITSMKGLTYKMNMMTGFDLCQFLPCCKAIEQVEDDQSSTFCSEFVASVYKELGLVDPHLDMAEFLPSFFDSTRHLWLANGARLGIEHVLVGPATLDERTSMGYRTRPRSGGANFWGVNSGQPLAAPNHAFRERRSKGPKMTKRKQEQKQQQQSAPVQDNMDNYQPLPGNQNQQTVQQQPQQQQFQQPQQYGGGMQFAVAQQYAGAQQFQQPQQYGGGMQFAGAQQFQQPQQYGGGVQFAGAQQFQQPQQYGGGVQFAGAQQYAGGQQFGAYR